jgi:type VI secretion system protein ImpE
MTALQNIRSGQFEKALDTLKNSLRDDPADPGLRTLFFQALALVGQWDEASRQLKVLKGLEAPPAQLFSLVYRNAAECEKLRAEVMGGRRKALVFGQPFDWVASMVASLEASPTDSEQSSGLRDSALESAPASRGKITFADRRNAVGRNTDSAADQTDEVLQTDEFEWISDADLRLGPILEAIIDGKYFWVPFERMQTVELEPPSSLCDVIWMTARFQWTNGGQSMGLIPTRYPSSESHSDYRVPLAQITDWRDGPIGPEGLGQRLLATNVTDYPLMDVRRIEIDAGPEPPQGTQDV